MEIGMGSRCATSSQSDLPELRTQRGWAGGEVWGCLSAQQKRSQPTWGEAVLPAAASQPGCSDPVGSGVKCSSGFVCYCCPGAGVAQSPLSSPSLPSLLLSGQEQTERSFAKSPARSLWTQRQLACSRRGVVQQRSTWSGCWAGSKHQLLCSGDTGGRLLPRAREEEGSRGARGHCVLISENLPDAMR